MITYLIAMVVILALLSGWIGVQHLARNFAARHPEFETAPEDVGGCGMFCFCKNAQSCTRQKLKSAISTKQDNTKNL